MYLERLLYLLKQARVHLNKKKMSYFVNEINNGKKEEEEEESKAC